MKYKTDHRVIEGNRADFEAQINALSERGYVWNCFFSVMATVNSGLLFHAVMSKTEEVPETQSK